MTATSLRSERVFARPPGEDKDAEPPSGQLRPWLDWRRANAFNRRVFLRLQMACGYRPLPWQMESHLAGATLAGKLDHKAAIGGFGAGKTAFGAAEMLQCVLANPGGIFIILQPSYDQINEVSVPAWEAAVGRVESCGYPIAKGAIRGAPNGPREQELVCGGKVLFRSYAVLRKLRGLEVAAAWADEIDTELNPSRVWAILLSRVRLTKTRRRRARRGQWPIAWREIVVTTTPSGRRGAVLAFINARRLAKDEGRDADLRHWYWIKATYRDNHHLPADYADSMRATYSRRRWRQEAEAEILAPESQIYCDYSSELNGMVWQFDPKLPYDLGFDGGDTYPHVLWIQRLGNHTAVVFDELCTDMSREECAAIVIRRCKAMGRPPDNIAIDLNPPAIRSWARRAFPSSRVIWPMTAEQKGVSDGIETVRSLLDPYEGDPRLFIARHLQRDPPRRGIQNCLTQYRYKVRPDGSVTSDPYKDWIHDHGADALRYWAVLVGTTPGPSVTVRSRYGPGSGGEFKLPHQR